MGYRNKMKVSFGEIQDISTIDYPSEVVSVLFFCGCPFRCPFCHNFNLIDQTKCDSVDADKIIDHVKKAIPFITGIAITGGEPTQQFDQLTYIVKKLKELNLLIKIDTNGYFSNNIKQLCDLNLVDYFAVDIKNEFKPKIYAKTVGLSVLNGNKIIKRVKESLQTIINSNSFLEARTTIVPGLNDSKDTIENICKEIIGVNRYVLQQFRCIDKVLDDSFSKLPSPSRDQLLNLAKIAKEYIEDVRIRTAENGEERL